MRLRARLDLGRGGRRGGSVHLNALATARTTVAFDSPTAWEVTVNPGGRPLPTSGDRGTHGRIALPPLKAPLEVRVSTAYPAD